VSVNQIFVSLVILLTPGIVAALVLDTATQHSKWDNFRFSLYIIILGFLSYFLLFALTQCGAFICPHFYQPRVFSVFTHLENVELGPNLYWEVFTTCIIAFFVALGVSYSVNHKLIIKFTNMLGISNKYGDESLFYYYLNWWKPSDKSVWLTVRDYSKKIVYTGDLSSFSEQDGMQEILLLNVDVYPDGKESYHLDEIYIAAKIGDISLEPMTIV